MKTIQSFLTESKTSPEWNGYFYHYIFNDNVLDKILSSGKIIPVNRSKDAASIRDYSERAIEKGLPGASPKNDDFTNAEIYWKGAYKRFYEPVVKKPYRNYGLFFTPEDLFSIDTTGGRIQRRTEPLKYRFKFRFHDLKGDTVIQVGAKVKLVRSEEDIKRVADQYTDLKELQRIYNTSTLKFRRLPQIVNFEDYIKVDKSMLEISK